MPKPYNGRTDGFLYHWKKSSKKYKDLEQGIIKKVNKSNEKLTLVVVPKDNGSDVRICVDMRRANEAVIREKHPLPTIDDFLPESSGAIWLSKYDVKSAFQQIDI